MTAGSRSPTYLRELERYAKRGGHFDWWRGRALAEIRYAALEDWSSWLAARRLGPKTRRNVLGAFRSFLSWLELREELPGRMPRFPWPKVDDYEPRVLSVADQDAILDAIPEARRGIFLAMAHLGLRPGEARALDVADVRDGWVTIDKAVKGCSGRSEIRGTKTGKGRRLPVGEDLLAWIERHVKPAGRLTRAPLFTSSRGRRWSHWGLLEAWRTACDAAGVPRVKLYEGTKHTMATDVIRRGVPERALQTFLGHSDLRSTRRYARMADEALLAVLRPSRLTGVCRQVVANPDRGENDSDETRVESGPYERERASPAGFEPALSP